MRCCHPVGLRDTELPTWFMSLAGRIKLALGIVAVVSPQASPARILVGAAGIEAIRQRDANKVADQIPIMEVVPDEDLDSEPSGA